MTVEITPPKMTLVYHQVEGPAAPASCLFLPPTLLENMGAAICAPLLLALNCCFVGELGYMCFGHILHVAVVICAVQCTCGGMSMPRGTEGGHR